MIAPGKNVLADYFSLMSSAELNQLFSMGVRAAACYTKNVTTAHVDNVHLAGMEFLAIVEGKTGVESLQGAAKGTEMGTDARKQLLAINYPQDASVVLVYQDAGINQPLSAIMPNIIAFTNAFWTALGWGTGWHLGYGGRDIGYALVDAGALKGVVEWGASAVGNKIPRDARSLMVQHPSGASPPPFTNRIDLNDVITPFPMWGLTKETEQPMATLIKASGPEIDVTDWVFRAPISGGTWAEWQKVLNVPAPGFIQISDALWNEIHAVPTLFGSAGAPPAQLTKISFSGTGTVS